MTEAEQKAQADRIRREIRSLETGLAFLSGDVEWGTSDLSRGEAANEAADYRRKIADKERELEALLRVRTKG